MEEIQFPDN